MNRAEAYEWAADYAQRAKIFEPVRNERGYADGWKPPSPADKVQVIKTLAESVMDEPTRFDAEDIIAFVEEQFGQHTSASQAAGGGKVKFLVHENFIREVRDHFRGRA